MTGGLTLYSKAMDAREKLESTREKWVEQHNDGEYLMVKCQCCGKPIPRQRVLRLSSVNIEKWNHIRAQNEKSYGFLICTLLLAAVTFAAFAGAINLFGNIWAGLIAGIIVYGTPSLIFCIRDKKKRCRIYEETAQFLHPYDLRPNDVSTGWATEWVILPEGKAFPRPRELLDDLSDTAPT